MYYFQGQVSTTNLSSKSRISARSIQKYHCQGMWILLLTTIWRFRYKHVNTSIQVNGNSAKEEVFNEIDAAITAVVEKKYKAQSTSVATGASQ